MRPFLFVWDYKGNLRPGFPKESCELQAVSDLDGDGRMEFICTDWGTLRILNSNGEVRSETDLPDFEVRSAAVGDLDNDGKAEIIAVLHKESDTWIGLFNSDGTSRPGWPVLVSSNGYNPLLAPVLADLNSDGAFEILCIDALRVIAIRQDGSNVPGWPVAVPSGTRLRAFQPLMLMATGNRRCLLPY